MHSHLTIEREAELATSSHTPHCRLSSSCHKRTLSTCQDIGSNIVHSPLKPSSDGAVQLTIEPTFTVKKTRYLPVRAALHVQIKAGWLKANIDRFVQMKYNVLPIALKCLIARTAIVRHAIMTVKRRSNNSHAASVLQGSTPHHAPHAQQIYKAGYKACYKSCA